MKKNFFSSFMQSRVLAIIILLVLIGLPVLIWWIFFQKSTSYVVVNVGSGITANVSLKWTFSNNFFPVADKIMEFSQNCENICRFGPIAPIKYNLEIKSPDFVDLTDEFVLANGQTLEKNYILTPKINYEFSDFTPETESQKSEIQDEIHSKNPNLTYLGTDLKWRKWVIFLDNSTTSLWFLRWDNFISLKNFSQIFGKIEFFRENNAFIFYNYSLDEAIFVDIDLQNILEIKLNENQKIDKIFFDKNWFVLENGILKEYKNSNFVENIRFSNFRDIDNYRLGYISQNDEKKLKIWNYNPDFGSVLVLLNRENGDIFEVGRNLEIANIFVIDDEFVFEIQKKFYKINPKKIWL